MSLPVLWFQEKKRSHVQITEVILCHNACNHLPAIWHFCLSPSHTDAPLNQTEYKQISKSYTDSKEFYVYTYNDATLKLFAFRDISGNKTKICSYFLNSPFSLQSHLIRYHHRCCLRCSHLFLTTKAILAPSSVWSWYSSPQSLLSCGWRGTNIHLSGVEWKKTCECLVSSASSETLAKLCERHRGPAILLAGSRNDFTLKLLILCKMKIVVETTFSIVKLNKNPRLTE